MSLPFSTSFPTVGTPTPFPQTLPKSPVFHSNHTQIRRPIANPFKFDQSISNPFQFTPFPHLGRSHFPSTPVISLQFIICTQDVRHNASTNTIPHSLHHNNDSCFETNLFAAMRSTLEGFDHETSLYVLVGWIGFVVIEIQKSIDDLVQCLRGEQVSAY